MYACAGPGDLSTVVSDKLREALDKRLTSLNLGGVCYVRFFD